MPSYMSWELHLNRDPFYTSLQNDLRLKFRKKAYDSQGPLRFAQTGGDGWTNGMKAPQVTTTGW